ncbi:MAG: ATP-binding protein [Azonexus sp.]
MTNKILADASPEKRLFISLLTRDISLVAAFLDLVDNSINAAIEPYAGRLETAEGYQELFADEAITPSVDIRIKISPEKVEITDSASGISAEVARDHVFKFGRSSEEAHSSDRLSVYGIGLKRALFKLGNRIAIRSDHLQGGFDLDLDVGKWAKETSPKWSFGIDPRAPVAVNTGTQIVVTDLYEDAKRRLCDGVFIGQLKEAITRTYEFFLAKFVRIYVNDEQVLGVDFAIGSNHASDEFSVGNISCAVTAGIGVAQGGKFRDKSSGWFVFCNGRTVISGDKTQLTGWNNAGLPIFQPKHRPFIGTVFFVSPDAEKLPWTTTKSAINEDSSIWQEAKRHMITVARVVVSFLDSRYTDEGTEVASTDLQVAAGDKQSMIAAAAPQKRSFSPPPKPVSPNTRIQYDAKVDDVRKIERYLGRPGMGGAEVGRYTFNYFLKNEVGDC